MCIRDSYQGGTWLATADNGLWGAVKTEYDPCHTTLGLRWCPPPPPGPQPGPHQMCIRDSLILAAARNGDLYSPVTQLAMTTAKGDDPPHQEVSLTHKATNSCVTILYTVAI